MQAEVFWIEDVPAGRLAVLPRPRGGDWLEDEVRSLRASGVEVLVSLLTTEETSELGLAGEAAYCAAAGIVFLTFPFADRSVPPSDAAALALVRRFSALLAAGKRVAIHCRQGVGRSALIAACVLASLGESPDEALERVARARGCPVPDTPEQREWVLRFTEKHLTVAGGTTLLLSTRSLPAGPALKKAAQNAGWSVHAWDDEPSCSSSGRVVYYGRTDVVRQAAALYRLALLEPPLDLLAQLPDSLRMRRVEFGYFRDLARLRQPTFVKPADPLDRCFDAGIYANASDIRTMRGIDPDTPVLVADPVEWLAEFRCFVREGQVVATSPYLSFGRPFWRAWGEGGEKALPSQNALAVCSRLLSERSVALPPAFVVDVGLIDGRGWAVVEFNPAWCSGLLGADPAAVLPVLERASQNGEADAAWVLPRREDVTSRVGGKMGNSTNALPGASRS
jgi:protein-tyrosine phosphatase